MVDNVVIDEAALTMSVDARFAGTVSPGEAGEIESSLCAQYGLSKVTLNAECPKPEPQKQEKKPGGGPKLLYGKAHAPRRQARGYVLRHA